MKIIIWWVACADTGPMYTWPIYWSVVWSTMGSLLRQPDWWNRPQIRHTYVLSCPVRCRPDIMVVWGDLWSCPVNSDTAILQGQSPGRWWSWSRWWTCTAVHLCVFYGGCGSLWWGGQVWWEMYGGGCSIWSGVFLVCVLSTAETAMEETAMWPLHKAGV